MLRSRLRLSGTVRAALWLLALLVVAGPVAARAAGDPPPQAKASAVVPAPKDPGELRAIEARVKQVVAKVLPCTVAVRVGNSQGSGVIVSREGHVATAGHLIPKPGEEVVFLMADGKTHKGVTLGMDKNLDSGLMKITEQGTWPFVEMGKSHEVQEGSWCVAVGHPLGYHEGRPPVVRIGRVLGNSDSMLRTDCTIVGGDSGGPLFDLDGRVIAIHSRIGNMANMNFHVPIDVYRDHWDQLLAGQVLHADLPGKDTREVRAPFRSLVAEAGRCVVRVKCDGHDTVLGTIVGPHGWVLTKASELKGKVVCRLRDGRELEARTVGIAPQFDLAMLKIEADGLPIIPWSSEPPTVGAWVASAAFDDEALAVGVVSVPQRRIPPPSGMLGVVLGDDGGGPKIMQVLPGSPAEKVGLKTADVITHVNGQAVADRNALMAAVKQFRPGDTVKLQGKRGTEKLELAVKLGLVETPGLKKRDMQNMSAGPISGRHDDFPLVLQHDGLVPPAECGGPLIDLGGRVVGVNIARAGRTETYSAPSEALLGLMYDLMSGRLAPPARPSPKPEPPKR